jgi:hypothetical protein
VKLYQTIGWSSTALLCALNPAPLLAQSSESTVQLTVAAGRSLEVVLEDRITIKEVGQPVTGFVVEPIYAYDRVVVPAGTKVLGHVAALEDPSGFARTRTMLQGDFTPHRQIVMQFDTIVFDDERTMPIKTLVKTTIPHLKRTNAPPSEGDTNDDEQRGVRDRAEREAKQQVKNAIASVKQNGRDILAEISQPGRMDRAKAALVEKLPYHRQFVDAGTGYDIELLTPLEFGLGASASSAPPDALPAPASILHARLLTPLDSSTTPRDTPIHAVVTEPVFTADRQLILPEGTLLDGHVTLAKPAKKFHRHGQLRFLFETVHLPAGDQVSLLASLQSVNGSADDNLQLDEEGGAKLADSKTRFIAPALSLLALRGTLDRHDHLDPDGDGHVIHSSNPGAVSVGGFFGLGLLGIPLAHMAPPVGVALSAVGAARSVYRNVLAKGREVQFPADTVMKLQLAPGPSGAK